MEADSPQQELFLPERFDMLRRKAESQLKTIIVPVNSTLEHIDDQYQDLSAAGRGGFLVFFGRPGSGKSTFLHTLSLFRDSVVTHSIPPTADIRQALTDLPTGPNKLQVIVLEGREATLEITNAALEEAIHAINMFIRSEKGEKSLVVWPCNTEQMRSQLVKVADEVGGDAMIGVEEPSYEFVGPGKDQFLDIAQRTIATLNQGASIIDFGVTTETAQLLIHRADTIGAFLSALRRELRKNTNMVKKLLGKEQCRLWVIVVASNEPENDVAALTRGNSSMADMERLMIATEANIVKELKQQPEKLGILAAVLDVRILHLPVSVALSITRLMADEELKVEMQTAGLSLKSGGDKLEKLSGTELARAFTGTKGGPRAVGRKIGPDTVIAFQKLVGIATKRDALLNRAIARGLEQSGMIRNPKTEVNLGTGLSRYSDVLCETDSGHVRLEFMWRAKTGRADIANYTLSKIGNYAKAIGLLP